MKPRIIICGPRFYNFEGYYFDSHNYLGPHPLKKNGELRKTIPPGFWGMFDRFQDIKNKEFYQVGDGGCRFF